MKYQKGKKSPGFWIYVVLAPLCMVTLPVFWILPFCSMPILDGATLEKSVEQQILEDAKAGQFAVSYTDIESVRISTLELKSEDVLVLAHGSMISDQGTFPYAVLLKKIPFVNRYLYDTRYRFNQLPASIENIKYLLLSYTVDIYGDTISVDGILQKGRTFLLLVFPYLWISNMVSKKLDPA